MLDFQKISYIKLIVFFIISSIASLATHECWLFLMVYIFDFCI